MGSENSERKSLTWDQLFSLLSPLMIREASEYEIKRLIGEKLEPMIGCKAKGVDKIQTNVDTESFGKIIVQFRALGLIQQSDQKRSVKDRGTTFWALTPYGDEYMNRLIAIKKTEAS